MNYFEKFKLANSNIPKSSKVIFAILIGLVLVNSLTTIITKPSSLIKIVVLIFSVSCHEVGHGFVANLLGDDTAKKAGRLSLNPKVHIDPIGTLIPAILILTGSNYIIGWAKPVPVNYYNLKDRKWSVLAVSLAGVIVNFSLVFIPATLLKIFPILFANEFSRTLFTYLILLNLVLGVFNLLPLPPLDGSKVLWSLGNFRVKNLINSMESWGIFIILFLGWSGILGNLISPVYNLFINLLNLYIS